MRGLAAWILLLAALKPSCQVTVKQCTGGHCHLAEHSSWDTLARPSFSACNTLRLVLDRDGAELSRLADIGGSVTVLPRLAETVCLLQARAAQSLPANDAALGQLLGPAGLWCAQATGARALPWLSLPSESTAQTTIEDQLLLIAALQFTQPSLECRQLADAASRLMMKEQPLMLAERWLLSGAANGRMRIDVGLRIVQAADRPSAIALEKHRLALVAPEVLPTQAGGMGADLGISAVLVRARVLSALRRSDEAVQVITLPTVSTLHNGNIMIPISALTSSAAA